MARHDRLTTLLTIKEVGILPIFNNSDFEIAKNVVCACVDGGAKVVEFTNRGDRAIDVFTRLATFRDKERPEIILGAGSIYDAATGAMYIAAGADFLVAPFLDEETAKLCNGRKVPYCPGCGSVTEIHQAHILGVEICKLFPAGQVGGPAFVKALRAPCPWTDILATGSVEPTRESLTEWLSAGMVCAGMGSKLITKELLEAKNYSGIAKNVRNAIELVKAIRKELG